MIQVLESFSDNSDTLLEFYVRCNDTVIAIKSCSSSCLNDLKLEVLVNLLKVFNIESICIIDRYPS